MPMANSAKASKAAVRLHLPGNGVCAPAGGLGSQQGSKVLAGVGLCLTPSTATS